MKPFQRVLREIDGTEKDGIVIKNIALIDLSPICQTVLMIYQV